MKKSPFHSVSKLLVLKWSYVIVKLFLGSAFSDLPVRYGDQEMLLPHLENKKPKPTPEAVCWEKAKRKLNLFLQFP